MVGILGFLLGSVTVTLLPALLPAAARLANPVPDRGAPALVGLYIRLRLGDTPHFAELAEADKTADSPLREAVATSWRQILQVIGLFIMFNIGYYVVFTLVPTYSITTLRSSKSDAFVSITLACLVALILILPLAALSDGSGGGRCSSAPRWGPRCSATRCSC